MKILNLTRLSDACRRYPDSENALQRWLAIAQAAQWRHFADLRQTDRSADQVKLPNGTIVTIFNIRGNTYRLITEIAYAPQIILIRSFLTHAAYDKNKWKDTF